MLVAVLALPGCHRTDGDTVSTDLHPTDLSTETGLAHSGTETWEELLERAVYWGVPAVVTARTVHDRAYNQMLWPLALPDAESGRGGAPNPDVLYAITSVDLRAEPLVVHTPDLYDRYWSVQMATFWTETFAYLGTRATGGMGGTYLLTPPGWEGTVPSGTTQIAVPSTQVVLLSRLQVRNRADLPAAQAAHNGFWARPLSDLDGTTPPPPSPVIPVTGMPDDTGRNGILFWDELGDVLVGSPPDIVEQPFLDSLAHLGIGPGLHPSSEVTDPELLDLLERVVEPAMDRVVERVDYDDWDPILEFGNFHGDWLYRAAAAWDGWITHRPEEGVYAVSPMMDANHVYRVHFDQEQLPPAGAFWSLTAYDEGRYLIANATDRYSVNSSDDNVVYNPDGSLDLVIAPSYPGGPVQDWIPTKEKGQVYLMLRIYLPGDAVLDGTWKPPPIIAD
ncbi:MAG: DUF1254 domain-containing protein [Myxococcales bacterium]|nr:DUF1254 domain-containing protein [Myxococcales bacterium]